MRLSTLLSKHLTDAANIQESNSVNYFKLCATIWKVRIFEGTPAIRNSGKKSATDQKRPRRTSSCQPFVEKKLFQCCLSDLFNA
jgi:hypothetical protein